MMRNNVKTWLRAVQQLRTPLSAKRKAVQTVKTMAHMRGELNSSQTMQVNAEMLAHFQEIVDASQHSDLLIHDAIHDVDAQRRRS
jgi:hypothetical protein